jgi:hypothetical protein
MANFEFPNNTSKVYNVNTSHPLIQNEQQYISYKKYVSIHSEDRDIIKYPSSSSFEIELPEDITNVSTIRLTNWTFPSNYDTFSFSNSNITMTFKVNPFNPSSQGYSEPLYDEIFKCLFLNQDNNFVIKIESGFYNPIQMTTELTNKFNYAVTNKIISYFTDTTGTNYNPITFPTLLDEFNLKGGYRNFIIVYNTVSQKIWFGNTTDQFKLTNSTQQSVNTLVDNLYCGSKQQIPNFSNWGLPGNLGLTRCDTNSISGTQINESNLANKLLDYVSYNSIITPRFFYGDVFPGDDGYWLLPNSLLPGSEVHWVESTYKINFMGTSYFYLEIDGLNCIDETSPYNLSEFTITTNETNGIVNSSFAKIAVPTTPISQWFDREQLPYKLFFPPADRIRRLKIKLRYHNQQLVDFGTFDYSLLFEFDILNPQASRKWSNAQGGGNIIFK